MVDSMFARAFCTLCSANCGVLVRRDEGGRVVSVKGDPDDAITAGWTCKAGRDHVLAVGYSPGELCAPEITCLLPPPVPALKAFDGGGADD